MEKITNEEYTNNLYNMLLVKKAIFSESIEDFMKKMTISKEDETFENFFIILHEFLNTYRHIYDQKVKNNVIDLAQYLLSNIPSINRVERINELNAIKSYLNNLESENYDFIKNEIAFREYGTKLKDSLLLKYIFIKHKEETLENVKDEIYDSICFDLDILTLNSVDDDSFKEKIFANYVLRKKFFRSLNYLLINHPRIFDNKDFVSRIFYIHYANSELIDNYDVENEEIYQEVDSEFFDLEKINLKLIKKRKLLRVK